MRKKPKFNTLICANCIYHGIGCNGYAKRIGGQQRAIYCDYAGKTGKTCLKISGREVVDRRGDDRNGCLLFTEGKKIYRKRLKL